MLKSTLISINRWSVRAEEAHPFNVARYEKVTMVDSLRLRKTGANSKKRDSALGLGVGPSSPCPFAACVKTTSSLYHMTWSAVTASEPNVVDVKRCKLSSIQSSGFVSRFGGSDRGLPQSEKRARISILQLAFRGEFLFRFFWRAPHSPSTSNSITAGIAIHAHHPRPRQLSTRL